MRAYVAGPMSNWPECNFPAFARATAHLRQQGIDVISPAEEDEKRGLDVSALGNCTSVELAETTFDLHDVIRRDVDYILESDAIVLIPGWEASKGATAELTIARWAGKRVGYMTCLITGVVDWEDER